MAAHRFPPPWSIEELDECFIVRDADGQAFGVTLYFDEEQTSPAIDRACPRATMRQEPVGGQRSPQSCRTL